MHIIFKYENGQTFVILSYLIPINSSDLAEFVGLVRQSNKAEYEDSPKTTATSIKTLR
jgi:hypothetical protein